MEKPKTYAVEFLSKDAPFIECIEANDALEAFSIAKERAECYNLDFTVTEIHPHQKPKLPKGVHKYKGNLHQKPKRPNGSHKV